MNITRESHVKVLGHWVRVPNVLVFERKRWSAAKIARAEQQAQALGDLQKFVTASPLFPFVCVIGFFAFVGFVSWAVPIVVDALL